MLKILAAATAVLVSWATCSAPSAAAASISTRGVVHVLAAFDPAKGEKPENLALGPDGATYVTWVYAHAVARVAANGKVTAVALPGGSPAGIAIDPLHPDQLTVGVISDAPSVAGIWTIPLTAFRGVGRPRRSVPLPVAAFPNGMTYTPAGYLYVADSELARIWQVGPGAPRASVWAESRLLAPTGASYHGTVLPGANGVHVHDGSLYVSNSSAKTLLRIPLRGKGTRVPRPYVKGLVIDDFTFDGAGDVIAAVNIHDAVVRIDTTGHVVTLADKADGIENPTAVALSPTGILFVTCGAYFANPGHPELVTIEPAAGSR
jgi:hypothetical protein